MFPAEHGKEIRLIVISVSATVMFFCFFSLSPSAWNSVLLSHCRCLISTPSAGVHRKDGKEQYPAPARLLSERYIDIYYAPCVAFDLNT